jgi:hypothetical protein
LGNVADERILSAIGLYSDIGAAQSLKDKLSREGMEIVQLVTGQLRETCVKYYFTGLKHLSDILAMALEKIEKLLPKLPA